MKSISKVKPYARALVALTVIAAPVAEAIAQTHQVPAEVIARRIAKKKARLATLADNTSKAAKAGGVQLYGYISSSDEHEPGLYTFNTSSPSGIRLVNSNVKNYGGATYAQGTYYSSYYEEDQNTGSTIKFPVHFYEYATSNWSLTTDKPSANNDFTAISKDLAFDPITQQIYGIFSDADYSGKYTTLGRLTYTDWGNNDVTTSSIAIGDMPESMVALTFTRNGDLYCFGKSGNLYLVNKYNANATLVGSTGNKPAPLFQSATCDFSTGKLYWAMLDSYDWATHILEVDPATGNSTLVSDFGEEGTQSYDNITGLYIPQDLNLTAVPQTINDLEASVTSLTGGTVSFTMPNNDVKGAALSGNISYTIRINGENFKTGSAAPGSKITSDFNSAKSGMTEVGVTTEIAANGDTPAAESAVASQNVRLGYDVPNAPKNVQASLSGQDVKISWTAPTSGVNNGYFDEANLKYKVVRFNTANEKDSVVLAENTAATTYNDHIESPEIATYYYKVAAINGDMQSKFVLSREIKTGTSVALPYSNVIDSEEKFGELTVVDANNDGSTWTFDTDFSMAAYKYNSDNAGDDWLMSPAVNMKKGSAYKFSFDAVNTYPTERVAASVGTAPTAEGMTTEIVAPTEITYSPRRHTLAGTFRATEDGLHYFGIHEVSDADCSTLFVGNMQISEVPASAPESATELSVTPGENGASSATIACKAPTTSLNGTALSGNMQIIIRRDGNSITTLQNIAPGATCSYTDEGVASGNHKYSVVAVNANGEEGLDVSQSVFVGTDIPGKVQNLKAVEDPDKEGLIHVTWDAPKGVNGGYVNPDELTYYISVGTSSDDIELGNKTSYDEQLTVNGSQVYTGYSVYAVNNSGGGREYWSTCTTIAGPAVKAPMIESFKNTTMKSGPWITNVTNGEIGEAYCYCMTESEVAKAQDGDGGMQSFSATELGKAVRSESPKVDISDMTHPTLNFWAYLNGDGDELNVSVQKDFGDFVNVRHISTSEGTKGWNRYSIDLTPYKDSKFIRIGFEGKAVKNLDYFLAYDNVAIVEKADNDLMAMSLTTDEKVSSGSETTIELELRNNAGTLVKGSDYDIVLYKNGNEVYRRDGVDIDADLVKSVVMKNIATVFDPEQTEYHATIDYSKDQITSNNTSSSNTVKVVLPDYPTATSLKAVAGANGVDLSWTAPDLLNRKAKATEESFDTYDAFIIDNIGGWTTYDGDKQNTIQITLNEMFGPLKYDNAGKPMAFQVFNSEKAGIPFASWDAHTGDQMLVSFSCASSDGGATKKQNDDWLISPQLNGEAQVISLYAKAGMGGSMLPEQFEILYSTTSKAISNFQKLGETVDVNNAKTWDEYEFHLPAGAKYFAIHCVSNNKFALLIDDITFVEAGSKPEELELSGYNVYRDGKKVNESIVSGNSYKDSNIPESKKYSYVVTAVYDKGESQGSNVAEVDATTGINDINNADVAVEATNGAIVVTGARGKTVCVYTIDGQQVARLTASDIESINVSAGMYIVTVNSESHKVLVK